MKRPMAMGSRKLNYANSPLLASKTPPWRSRFVVALMALGSLALLGRAAYVQLMRAPFYVDKGEARYAYKMPLSASRGRILDRNGNVLATSVPVPSVWLSPKEFRAANVSTKQRTQLAQLLNMPLGELDERVQSKQEFVWLRRKVDEAVWQQIQALGIKGVRHEREYQRKYPEGETVAQVVGRTSFVDDLGQEGVELYFQQQLQGHGGEHRVVRNRLGHVVDELAERREPVNGHDVQLSIDSRLQYFAWHNLREAVERHGAKAGSAVVLDARSGEILALANVLGGSVKKTDLAERQRNRALTDTFEPGSTMKPFIVSWAMQSRRLTPQSTLPNEPLPVAGGLFVRDDHPLKAPRITLAEVVARSSNSGTARLAMQMERAEMHGLLSKLGFGQTPQIEFPGARTGRLRKAESWMPIDQATMSYGYGVSTSLLQLARAYTVFARDGQLSDLSILRQNAPLPGSPVYSPETARTMREMLGGVVTRDGGTAKRAFVEGYSVGGKTGTAQMHVKGVGYDKTRFRAWFVGLAPLSDPRIVVAVMVDEPRADNLHTGGAVAAPVFSKVVQQTLRTMGVEPDLEVRARVGTVHDGLGLDTP